MPDTLHARLVAALNARLERARAASTATLGRGSTPTGEHWRWECRECDTPIEITPVTVLDEFLECPNCQTVGVDIRSTEEYDGSASGRPLAHLVTHGCEEITPPVGLFIAANDPATVIRRVEALLRVVERHAPKTGKDWQRDVGQFDVVECSHCELTSNDGDPLYRRYPCPTIRDLAAGEGIEVGE